MKTQFTVKAMAVAIGMALATSAVVFNGQMTPYDGFSSVIPSAMAAQGEGGQKGRMGGQGKGAGGQGMQGKADRGQRGGKSIETLVSDEVDDGDDSDRPDWAMGNKEANPHRGDSNPTPGDRKGDEYGDLFIVVRDPFTGEPILVDGEMQVCLDSGCEQTVLTVDGEVPEGVTPVEVEFGRLNIGRAPTKVIDHALDEAMSKITDDGVVLGLDAAGRITVNGVTIDSPLENLALYIAVMSGDQEVLSALESLGMTPFELAATLLGGSADKTGEITVDLLYYSNQIYDLVPSDATFVDYTTFTYDRSIYDKYVSYFYMDGDEVKSAFVNLSDYLAVTQPSLDGASAITLFSIASDDALEIVELIHTQIHENELPGSVTSLP